MKEYKERIGKENVKKNSFFFESRYNKFDSK